MNQRQSSRTEKRQGLRVGREGVNGRAYQLTKLEVGSHSGGKYFGTVKDSHHDPGEA
jgi:hypothetical protein